MVVRSTGSNPILDMFPKEKVGFAIITNGIDYRLNDISLDVLRIVFDKPYKLPNLVPKKWKRKRSIDPLNFLANRIACGS